MIIKRLPQVLRACLALGAAAICGTAALGRAPQSEDLRLPVSLDADSTTYDGKSSMVMFRGLRLTQGRLSIAADEGYASKMDFEQSTWHFEGNVVIDTENSHIESDVADMEFNGYQLKTAVIIGTPAIFDMQRPGRTDTTHAEAGKLVYNLADDVVEFSENATITEGGNKISSSFLVYNIADERISATSGGEDDPKVRIIYTPGPLKKLSKDELNDDNQEEDLPTNDAGTNDQPPEEGESG